MNDFSQTGVFLADNVPGAPPVLYIGTEKVELDDGTALQWLQVILRYFEAKVREVVNRRH